MGFELNTPIDGVLLNPLTTHTTAGGEVKHGLKSSDPGYVGFGEIYFSAVDRGAVRGWKRHRAMTLNLIVPVGAIRFVIYDDRAQSPTCCRFQQVTLSLSNYQRLTIPPMLWVAFQGCEQTGGLMANIANIQHSPDETDHRALDELDFCWAPDK
jgi:dTDP-4-dehydrorhamnose 3,5-epimerase